MSAIPSKRERRLHRWITVLSIAIPLVVAVLFTYKIPHVQPLWFLPPIYASLNGLTAVLLVGALLAIKKGKRGLHQRLMTSCVVLSALFLVLYVAYHLTSETTVYGGEGVLRYVYYFVLLTHILLSIAVIPLVLLTYAKAYIKDFARHKHWARYTFPIWLYVAVSGVVVYLLISPYYSY